MNMNTRDPRKSCTVAAIAKDIAATLAQSVAKAEATPELKKATRVIDLSAVLVGRVSKCVLTVKKDGDEESEYFKYSV